ncbi:hypothetical protein HDU97_006106, partial [Phlyctochytrium planicorne]
MEPVHGHRGYDHSRSWLSQERYPASSVRKGGLVSSEAPSYSQNAESNRHCRSTPPMPPCSLTQTPYSSSSCPNPEVYPPPPSSSNPYLSDAFPPYSYPPSHSHPGLSAGATANGYGPVPHPFRQQRYPNYPHPHQQNAFYPYRNSSMLHGPSTYGDTMSRASRFGYDVVPHLGYTHGVPHLDDPMGTYTDGGIYPPHHVTNATPPQSRRSYHRKAPTTQQQQHQQQQQQHSNAGLPSNTFGSNSCSSSTNSSSSYGNSSRMYSGWDRYMPYMNPTVMSMYPKSYDDKR